MASPVLLSVLFGAVLAAAVSPAWAVDTKPQTGDGRIYTCTDSAGRRLSSDRPIPECLSQEQRVLGRDGSQRGVVPPLRSQDEQERLDNLKKQQSQDMATQNEAVRRDRMLLTRYPDPSSHDLARQRALAPVQKLVDAIKTRLHTLEAEADGLATERAALGNRSAPDELRSRINANEGATEAQRTILQNQEAERERIVQQFDAERSRLQQLWAGAAPGAADPAARRATP